MHDTAIAAIGVARLAALCGAMCWTSTGAAGPVIPVSADALGLHAVVETFEVQLGITVEQDLLMHDGGPLTIGTAQPGHVFLLSGRSQAGLPPAAGSCSRLVAPVFATLVLPLRGDGAGAGAGSFSFDARVPTDPPVGLSAALQVWRWSLRRAQERREASA